MYTGCAAELLFPEEQGWAWSVLGTVLSLKEGLSQYVWSLMGWCHEGFEGVHRVQEVSW